MELNDWELEGYINKVRKDLYKKFINGDITLDEIRKITGIKKRKEG